MSRFGAKIHSYQKSYPELRIYKKFHTYSKRSSQGSVYGEIRIIIMKATILELAHYVIDSRNSSRDVSIWEILSEHICQYIDTVQPR